MFSIEHMLSHLTVRNLALVDQIALEFGPGLNVLTGETGAGKSVLVNALSLILGARAHADMVRTGASEAVVEALFDGLEPTVIGRLSNLGVSAVDGQLLVRRVLSKSGRSRVQLNGQLATVGMLGKLMRGMLDITSQHEHVTLLDPETHLDALDTFGGLEGLRSPVAGAYDRVRQLEASLEALKNDETAKVERADALRQAVAAIDAAALEADELDRLEAELVRLRHQTELQVGVQGAEDALYSGEGAVIEVVGQVLKTLDRLAAIDEVLQPARATLTSVTAELDDLARTLARYQGRLDCDPGRLDDVEDRIQTLRSLARRYGGDLETVLRARDEMADELAGFESVEGRIESLSSELDEARVTLSRCAQALTAARRETHESLAAAIQAELRELSMAKARVEVRLEPLRSPGQRGAETAELLMSPNPGEPLKPLRRVASGGEMSRLLLALKKVFAHRSHGSTYVFDEIDTGIGGAVAEVLGTKLRTVAGSSQVIAVTHLPQVAAFADVHFQVEKNHLGRRTVTEVTRLSAGQQVTELARMLGGLKITAATRNLAEEMRNRAIQARPGAIGRVVAATPGR